MQATVTPNKDTSFGAIVTNVDLNDLDEATWRCVEDAFHQHAALVFPAQHLCEEAQAAFAARFGEIELLRENTKAIQISNKNPDGTVPSSGGETELADMCSAYDALAQGMKERIADLCAYHSLYASQAKLGYSTETGAGYGYHAQGAPLRPLVKIHPVTGRPALCIGRHSYRIPGLEDAEAQALLNELFEFACQPPRVYTHNWQPGDFMVWGE